MGDDLQIRANAGPDKSKQPNSNVENQQNRIRISTLWQNQASFKHD